MVATQAQTHPIKLPPNLNSQDFFDNKLAYYHWLREQAPVYLGKISIIEAYMVSRYEDCVMVLKNPLFVRDKSKITGGSKLPLPSFIPLPKAVELMSSSMINEDEPDHRRLRSLVHQAFTQKSLAKTADRIARLTTELLDKAEEKAKRQGSIDLKQDYALPIPVTVIQELVGVADEDMPTFHKGVKAMTSGFSGWAIARTLLWELPRLAAFIRELIDRKRNTPGDDNLTGLIQAEAEGEKLSEDEIVSMVFTNLQ